MLVSEVVEGVFLNKLGVIYGPNASGKSNMLIALNEVFRLLVLPKSDAAEYEAVQLYQQLAESIDDKLSIEVLQDIANEEKVHAGEFLRLLHYLDKNEAEYYEEGAKEVEEEIEKLHL